MHLVKAGGEIHSLLDKLLLDQTHELFHSAAKENVVAGLMHTSPCLIKQGSGSQVHSSHQDWTETLMGCL